MGKNIADFGFSQLISTMPFAAITKEIEAEYAIPISEEDLADSSMLNHAQRDAFNKIMQKVNANVPTAFFIDGPGGTAKSFLYKALLATVRSKGDIALTTATSGAAASILPGGRTAHSRFKIPLQQEINSTCNISKQSAISKLVQLARLIIWDEAAMAKKYAIESFDRLLKDLLNSDSIFGEKVIVFCGDFRQTLPMVKKGQREDYISASLVNSYLWPHLEKIQLIENMRARSNPSFSDFLLKIGNGIEPTILNNKIRLPSSMLIPFIEDTTSLDLLINIMYPSLFDFLTSSSTVTNRAILSTTNETVQEVNQILIQRFPGQEIKYISFDQTFDPTKQADHGDFLNSIQPPGLPPHELILKPMCQVILLRNLNPAQGLCNGTRLICLNFDKNVIHAEISVGIHTSKHVFISRIPLHSSNDESYPIPFKQTQFPISLCFAMTINKSQGQTLDFVRIYLKEPVFLHRQLYVALSRAKTSANVKILLRPVTVHSTETSYTRNIVYDEILAAAADT
ncbi:ATP-dependent DNA helicase PIF1-like [Coffea eugenioides]|uniref:ATP-dependent DNA helicase PIF1-like n=1 Tax=Coffea eugenioides TaxID=49369 RepID=UPI000F612CC7|nr:ATP-dependent DNA helicase PIF1-like [Coffea eugenioides]